VARHQGERDGVAGEGGPPDPPPPGHRRLLGLVEGPVVDPGGGGDLLAAAGAHRPENPWAGDDLAVGCVAGDRGAGAGEQAHHATPVLAADRVPAATTAAASGGGTALPTCSNCLVRMTCTG